jgi:hypothetical protein
MNATQISALERALTQTNTPEHPDGEGIRLGRLESIGDHLACEVFRRGEFDPNFAGSELDRAARLWVQARGVTL